MFGFGKQKKKPSSQEEISFKELYEKYREQIERLIEIIVAIIVGFVIAGIIMALGGYDPIKAYSAMFETSFSLEDPYYLAMTLSFATPLMLTALTFAVGVRAGLFNIGAEGQVYMGALGAIIVASMTLPGPLYFPLAFLLGMFLGSLWGLIAGVLKSFRKVNEVVTTIMLNWIAYWIVEYARVYVYADPERPEKTISMPEAARLPILVPGSELSLAFIIALGVVILVYYLLWHTVLGYEIRATGMNPNAARYGGIDPRLAMLSAFMIGGVTAGIAGVLEICGRPPTYAITTGLSNLMGLGFDGIAVSLIGANHPLAIIPAAIFIGALTSGSRGMQIVAGVPLEMVKAVQGIIIMALAVPGLVRLLKTKFRRGISVGV
ncbi:ABC transporter permease [Desulfurococcaceae archaeon MEX13E-LK6-19]|nr:ABC transporter permease [Desulfurococcaceae archaeon MEX13E-LK6-19]